MKFAGYPRSLNNGSPYGFHTDMPAAPGEKPGAVFAKAAAKATHSPKRILVDVAERTKLMIAHGVGVSVEHIYTVMQIDNDYFEN